MFDLGTGLRQGTYIQDTEFESPGLAGDSLVRARYSGEGEAGRRPEEKVEAGGARLGQEQGISA